jgi:predicted PurR-regulated permease PerM
LTLKNPSPDKPLLRRAAPLLTLALLGILAWQLASILLLLFGAVVIAVLLRSLSDPISRRTPLPPGASLALVLLGILVLAGGGGWLFGLQITGQVNDILDRSPAAWFWIQSHLAAFPAGRYLLNNVALSSVFTGAGVVSHVTAFATNGANAVTDVLLVLVGGAYLAIDPQLYVKGALILIPRGVRPNITRALAESGDALRSWLLGQAIAMVLIGVLTGIGLELVHSPSALVLGLFAGLAEFIPIVGPVIGAAPALLTALSVGPHQVLWTALVFVVIQQLEGNAIQPFIQRRMVAVAPVVGLFGLAALGLLFGPIGLLLAAPLTVIIVVWVKALYVRDVLGEPIDPKANGE